MELGRRRPEGERDVAAEAGFPPEAGGEEQPVAGERIGMTLPVDPRPGGLSGADQHRTPLALVRRLQPLIDRRIVRGDGPSERAERRPNGRGICDGTPSAVFGQPSPDAGQAKRGADQLIGRHRIGRASACGHGGQLNIETAGQGGDSVGTRQASVPQGEIARMDPGVGMSEPPGRLSIGDAGAQALGNGVIVPDAPKVTIRKP